MIYLVSGEPYQANQFVNELKLQKLKEGFEYYSFDREDFEGETEGKIFELLASNTLFGRPKMIVVLSGEPELIKLCEKESSKIGDSLLIFLLSGEKRFKVASRTVISKHFEVPKGSGLEDFVVKEFQKRGGSLAAISLFSHISPSLATLYPIVNEIEKMSLAKTHIRDVFALDDSPNAFALSDAFMKKDIQKILTLFEHQLKEGQKPFDILNRILWQLRALLLVQDHTLYPKLYTLSFHPFVIKKGREALGFFSKGELEALFLKTISLYEKMLYSSLPSELLLSLFFLKL